MTINVAPPVGIVEARSGNWPVKPLEFRVRVADPELERAFAKKLAGNEPLNVFWEKSIVMLSVGTIPITALDLLSMFESFSALSWREDWKSRLESEASKKFSGTEPLSMLPLRLMEMDDMVAEYEVGKELDKNVSGMVPSMRFFEKSRTKSA